MNGEYEELKGTEAYAQDKREKAMKLKTLRSLEDCTEDGLIFVHPYEVRDEAIKHIKMLEEGLNIPESSIYKRNLNDISRGKINWIKHFFNITEERLEKEGEQ